MTFKKVVIILGLTYRYLDCIIKSGLLLMDACKERQVPLLNLSKPRLLKFIRTDSKPKN